MTSFVLREASDLVDQLTQVGKVLEGDDKAYWERELPRKVPSLKFDFDTMDQEVDVVEDVALFHLPLAREFLDFFTDNEAPWVVEGDVVVPELASLVNALQTVIENGRQASIDAMADVRANIADWTVRHVKIAQNLGVAVDALVENEAKVGRDFRKEMYLKVAQNLENGELPLQSRYVRDAMLMLFGDRAEEYATSLGIEAKSTLSSPRSKEAAAFLASVGMKFGALGATAASGSMAVGLLMGELVMALQDVLATPAVTDILTSVPVVDPADPVPTDPKPVPPAVIPVPSVPAFPITPPRLVDPVLGEEAAPDKADPLAAEINAILGILNAALVLVFGKDRGQDLRTALGLSLFALTPTEAPQEGVGQEIQDSISRRHGDLVSLVDSTFVEQTQQLQSLGFFAGATELLSGIWEVAPLFGSARTYVVGAAVGAMAYVLFAPRFGSPVSMRTRTAALSLSLYTSFGAVMALNFVPSESGEVDAVGGFVTAPLIACTVPVLIASSIVAVLGLVWGAVSKHWAVRGTGALGLAGTVYAAELLRHSFGNGDAIGWVGSAAFNTIVDELSWPLFLLWAGYAFLAIKIVDIVLDSARPSEREDPVQRALVKKTLRYAVYGVGFVGVSSVASTVMQIPFGPSADFQNEWFSVLSGDALSLQRAGLGNVGVPLNWLGAGFTRTVWQNVGPGQLAYLLTRTTFLAPLIMPFLNPFGVGFAALAGVFVVLALVNPAVVAGLNNAIDELTDKFVFRGMARRVWRRRSDAIDTLPDSVYVQDDDGEIEPQPAFRRDTTPFEFVREVSQGLVEEAQLGVEQARDIAEATYTVGQEALGAVANMVAMTPLMTRDPDDEEEIETNLAASAFDAFIGEPLKELTTKRSLDPWPLYLIVVSVKLGRAFDPSALGLPSKTSFKIPENRAGDSVFGPVSILSQSRRRPARPIKNLNPDGSQ